MRLKVILILLIIPISVFPFDGQKKGLVAGFGLGVSPSSTFDRQNSVDEENVAISYKFLVGYGFDSKNLLVYQILGSYVKSDVLNNTIILQGLYGIRWYHYFNGVFSNKIFASAGVGKMAFGSEYSNIGGVGLGFELGVGHEFKRHFQLELFYIWGETESDDNRTTSHTILSFLLSAHAF